MPECGSQVILCDLPVRFDTYQGCSHGCKYCFASKKVDIADIRKGETAKALKRFIDGYRNQEVNWCDWDIPLHWGGLSDPFQPIEAEIGSSFECLTLFKKTQYPVVFSTKGELVASDKYLEVISGCNCAGQVSITTADFIRKYEPGAPPFSKRMEMLKALAPCVKRLIVRIQPYLPEMKLDVLKNLSGYKQAGVYGIVVEGLKTLKKKAPCIERVAGDFCIPIQALRQDFSEIKAECRRLGLTFFSGENRLRTMGDSLCCCGVEGLEGWRVNRGNLNHIYFGQPVFTEAMMKPGTGEAFRSAGRQETVQGKRIKANSYHENMMAWSKGYQGRQIYGLKNDRTPLS